ncbi:hypothetical protein SD70_28430 [Gordoniibacillus kamchatkensis]|uniref:Uncharacterized protein n=1 Tax=Gordoniibacillus kamchatkensis TaxID=1590651 RepID=A0ABR5AAR6_9BACL|nr:hypothetical protein [Paenibacillus sp. VKM B-2647]KIL38124.1 hypothetical protein SD70_28430 [Paenibacillus sp. VKM B-2647]
MMNVTEQSKKVSPSEVSLLRLYLLRGGYLLIVVGLGITKWPEFINRSGSWELMEGIVQCMLLAFWALCVLGLRYPLQMLPVLLWELAWKTVWLIIVALPIWTSGRMDDATMDMVTANLWVVVFPFVIPWRFVFANYVRKLGDRWV